MSDIEAKRLANREAFPAVSAIVDEFRDVFGDDVKVLGGEDHSTGKRFGNDGREMWEGCDGCTGRTCDHPQRATVFCGHRERIEKAYVAGLWVNGGCMRLKAVR